VRPVVVRKTGFDRSEGIEDVAELCRSASDELQLPSLVPHFQTAGFVFSCNKSDFDDIAKAGPIAGVQNVTKKAKKVQFSTAELAKKNNRIAQSLEEIFILSDEALDSLIDDIRAHIAVLYRTAEAISLLDMVCAFARIAMAQGYSRPEFSSALAIKAGRHALIERFQDDKTGAGVGFVPNDTFANAANAFQVITGANCSGKSTYLRQIALIIVLSQIGWCVVATARNLSYLLAAMCLPNTAQCPSTTLS
jgi:DNA mismatch repair protein MSH4